jgi:hypothetical protein
MGKMVYAYGIMFMLCFCSCQKDLIEYGQGDFKVGIEQGDNWLHDYPLFLGFNKKNPPQIAIWIEDVNGNYVSTVYASYKRATQSWQSAGRDRRKEALPYWCHCRGVKYVDGLYLPTKKQHLTDGITGATPTESFDVKLHPTKEITHFKVMVEVNHSTDFNEYYPKSAKEGDYNYSGGKNGSGQPALVYCADINTVANNTSFIAQLVGHSSADGSDGKLYNDLSGITSALNIVKRIIITLQ